MQKVENKFKQIWEASLAFENLYSVRNEITFEMSIKLFVYNL